MRRTAAQSAEIKEKLRLSLLSGDRHMEFARESGLSLGWVYRMAWDMGFNQMLVTAEEREHLLKRRTQ